MTETAASSASLYYTDYSVHSSSMRSDYSSLDSSSGKLIDNSKNGNLSHEALMEKKRKNASAQAAFRQRRSTYIANLEETVTSLESVVRRLQDACRDAHDDVTELRQENTQLKALIKGFEERERIWKAYAKATAGTPAAQLASSQLSGAAHQHGSSPHQLLETPLSSTGSLQEQSTASTTYAEEGTVYGDDAYGFGKVEESDVEPIQNGIGQNIPFRMYSTSSQSTTVTTSPTSYTMDHSDQPSSGQMSNMPPTPSSSIDCNFNGLSALPYSGNGVPKNSSFCVDANMPPPTGNYTSEYSLPPYAITVEFVTSPSQQQSLPAPSLPSPLDSSMDATVDYTGMDQADTSSPMKDSSRASKRRHTYAAFPAPLPPVPRGSVKSTRTTRANPDGILSNTLAVIKAQAFGNVRKTRARAKKANASGDAARAALEILEARGLGLGLDISGGVKRRKRGDLPGPADRD